MAVAGRRVSQSAWKQAHPEDTDDPDEVGLSSEDEAEGMDEIFGVQRRLSRFAAPSGSEPPSGSQPPAGSDEQVVTLRPGQVVVETEDLQQAYNTLGAYLSERQRASASAGRAPSAAAGRAPSAEKQVPFQIPPIADDETRCPICRKGYKTHERLKTHIDLVHSGKGGHACGRCGKVLASRNAMSLHKIGCGADDTQLFHCDVCNKPYKSKQAMVAHKKVAHTDPPVENLKCRHCGREKFTRAKSLKEHERDCTENEDRVGPFACPVDGCELTFTRVKNLNRHLKNQHNWDPKKR